MNNEIKYPNVTVSLLGQDGNAFSIIAETQRALKNEGVSKDEIKEFQTEAMSGDYDHLIQTVMKWVNVE